MTTRLFGYKPPAWLAFAFVAVAIGATLFFNHLNEQRRKPGYIKEIAAIAAGLKSADRVGDKDAALSYATSTAAALTRMEKDPAPPPNKRYCILAAQHLLQVALDVSEGGTWHNRTRFEASMKACD